LNLFSLHLKTRASVYAFVLAAQRTIAAFGFNSVGKRTWGPQYEYRSTPRKHVVVPGEDPQLGLYYWSSRGYDPMKMFPEGQFLPR
jgi:hypothetical protein